MMLCDPSLGPQDVAFGASLGSSPVSVLMARAPGRQASIPPLPSTSGPQGSLLPVGPIRLHRLPTAISKVASWVTLLG